MCASREAATFPVKLNEGYSHVKRCRYAGSYVDAFKKRQEEATALGGEALTEEQLFDELEKATGIESGATVCGSAVDAQYASKCCDW